MYITHPSIPAGYDVSSVLKQSSTGLKSDICFSKKGCHTKAWKLSLPDYFTHSRRENNSIHNFPNGINSMWNAKTSYKIWSQSQCPFPPKISIWRQAPPECVHTCVYVFLYAYMSYCITLLVKGFFFLFIVLYLSNFHWMFMSWSACGHWCMWARACVCVCVYACVYGLSRHALFCSLFFASFIF